MSNIYNKTVAVLKTVEHDTKLLDAQKILIYPGGTDKSERKNLLDIINGDTSALLEQINTNAEAINSNKENIKTNSEAINANSEAINIHSEAISTNNEILAKHTEEIAANTAELQDYIITEESYYTVDTTFYENIDKPSELNALSLHLGYQHCPDGIINKISLKVKKTQTGNSSEDIDDNIKKAVYLVVNVCSGPISWPTIISRHKSINAVKSEFGENDDYSYTEWDFSNNPISLKENQWIKIFTSSTENPSDYNHYKKNKIISLYDGSHWHSLCGYKQDENSISNSDTYIQEVINGILGTKLLKPGLPLVKFDGIFKNKKFTKTTKFVSEYLNTVKGSLLINKEPSFNTNDLAQEITGQTDGYIKGFALGRKHIKNGIYSALSTPTTSKTNNSYWAIQLRIKDKNNNIIKTLYSDGNGPERHQINDVEHIVWTFNNDNILIDENVGFIDAHFYNKDNGTIVENNNANAFALLTRNVLDNAGFISDTIELDGTELTGHNPNYYIPHVYFYQYSIGIDNNLTSNSYFNNNIMVKEVSESISDLPAWLREEKVSISQVDENAGFSEIILGKENTITRINLNDLKAINSDYFANNCTIKGDVILYLYSLEEIHNKIFNTLTLENNASLTVELIMLDKLILEEKLATSIVNGTIDENIIISSPRKLIN